jgi:hypothetical protein
MIFPIGHDQAKLVRLPWVTLALLSACVASFLTMRGAQSFAGGEPDVSIDAAFDVWAQHPYLALDPQLLAEAQAGRDGENVGELVARAQAEAGSAKVDPGSWATQQRELGPP